MNFEEEELDPLNITIPKEKRTLDEYFIPIIKLKKIGRAHV